MMQKVHNLLVLGVTALLVLAGILSSPAGRTAAAAETPSAAPAAKPPAGNAAKNSLEEMVRLNFPDEIELEGLVEYVSHRLNVKILYDESIKGKKIRVRAPGEIPANSLMMVLQCALKIKGMMIVDADVKGWKEIRVADNLAAVAARGKAGEIAQREGAAAAVMQVFVPKYIDVAKIEPIVKPFVSKPGGSLTLVKEAGVLIVTDYAGNVLRMAELIDMLDRPKPDIVTQFVLARNVDAGELAKHLNEILSAQAQARGQGAEVGVFVSCDTRTNQVILVGRRERVDATLGLFRSLDVPSSLVTEVYPFKHIGARQIDDLIKHSLDPAEAKRVYRSVVDTESNSLAATTTASIHEQIAMLKRRLDVSAARKQSNMRFYKLKNTSVVEVLKTIRAIQQAGAGGNGRGGAADAAGNGGVGIQEAPPSSVNRVAGGISLPLQPGEAPPPLKVIGEAENREQTRMDEGGSPWDSRRGGQQGAGSGMSSFSQNASITADANTNTLIIIADPQVQEYYQKLIQQLDHRSPQVLIEAKVVTIDTTDNFSLGVELSGGERTGINKLFAFSSFGLSTPDPTTGALALIPGVGFNGALVDPSSANVIIQALSTHTRAKVIAAPRVLVNDNVEGKLQSVISIPYASVNASQTVATNSLGGNQDAGTIISVMPHIGEADYLQLKFSIQFSSFSQQTGSSNLPPPRNIDQVDSTVTIPDGYTVIVGGLNRHDKAFSVSGLPFLENIPVLKYAFSNRSRSDTQSTLFVFIRPIILRNDRYEDLKFLSDRDKDAAQISPEYPTSCPLLIK